MKNRHRTGINVGTLVLDVLQVVTTQVWQRQGGTVVRTLLFEAGGVGEVKKKEKSETRKEFLVSLSQPCRKLFAAVHWCAVENAEQSALADRVFDLSKEPTHGLHGRPLGWCG